MSRFLSLSSCHRAATLAVACLFATAAPMDAQSPAPTPSWWTNQGLLRSAAPADSAFATVGQLKNTVWCLARELDQRWTAEGGCGDELRAIVRSWDRNFPASSAAATNLPAPDVVKDGSMLAVINQGQLKNMAITAYRRLKELGLPIDLQDRDPANGALVPLAVDPDDPAKLPWRTGENAAPALVGQLKFCFSFELRLPGGGKVVAWGDNKNGQVAVPAGLDDVVAIAAGAAHCLALKSDGLVVAWGSNSHGQSVVPSGLSGVVAVAAGIRHSLALKSDGTVVAWGLQGANWESVTVPPGLGGVVAVAAGSYSNLALKSDGTVVAWGVMYEAERAIVASLRDIVAITMHEDAKLALRRDGTVVAWGRYTAPLGLNRVVAVATGARGSLALRSDGTVVAWDNLGQFNAVPADLTDVVQIAEGNQHHFAVKSDGTVVGWAASASGPWQVPSDLTGVRDIAAGDDFGMAIVRHSVGAPVWKSRTSFSWVEWEGSSGVYYRARVEGGGPVRFSALGLPPGLSIDPDTGIVSGTLTEQGVWTARLRAENTRGEVSDWEVEFNLADLRPRASWLEDSVVVVGKSLSKWIPSQNVATWEVTGLPPGMAWDAEFGVASGKPMAGTYDVTFTARNAFGSASYNWRVEATRLEVWGRISSSGSSVPKGVTDPVAIAAGSYHCLALMRDATVVAWGYNSYGQVDVPPDLNDIVAIAAGGNRSLALRRNGTVVGWGNRSTVPSGLGGVVSIAAGENHCLALRNDGTVVTWGGFGQGDAVEEVPVSGVMAIAAGGYHGLALKNDGTVFAWGSNSLGQTTVPTGLRGVVAISAGVYHSLALKSDGTVVAWGADYYFQGRVNAGLKDMVAIAAGSAHNVVLQSDGTVGAWGYSSSGQTTVPVDLRGVVAIAAGWNFSLALTSHPFDPPIWKSAPWASFSEGGELEGVYYRSRVTGTSPINFSASGLPPGLTLDAATGVVSGTPQASGVWPVQFTAADASGRTARYQVNFDLRGLLPKVDAQPDEGIPLGLPYSKVVETRYATTVNVTGLPPGLIWDADSRTVRGRPTLSGVYEVIVDAANAFGSTRSSKTMDVSLVVPWGSNAQGVQSLSRGLIGVVSISASYYHSLALREDGTVVAWGDNQFGQATVPVWLRDVAAVAAAEKHSLALRSDGTVVAWGSASQSTVPAGLSGVVAIAAGGSHSLALKSDGTVVAWGDNFSGESKVPAGLGGVVAIAAGVSHSLALKSDGTVVAWGNNSSGQSTVPAGLSGVIAIAAGVSHSLALKSDGTVVAWGNNSRGQTALPEGLSGVVAVAAGGSHSLALKSDGSVVAWGYNAGGQTDVPTGLGRVETIAAGVAFSLALLAEDGEPNRPYWLSAPQTFDSEGWQLDGVYYRARVSGRAVSFSAVGLPPGLSIDSSTGVVSGRPQSEGTWTAIVTATTATGQASELAVIFELRDLQFKLDPLTAVSAFVGQSIFQPITVRYGAIEEVKGLPSGLTWDASTGRVTGEPLVTGIYSVTVTARNEQRTIVIKWDVKVTSVASWLNYGLAKLPAAPEGLGNVVAIAPGFDHALALKDDGTVVAWGGGTSGAEIVPVGLTGVVAIAAGRGYSLALKNDGTVAAWGSNQFGQIAVPAGLSGVVAISAGWTHGLALRNDGTVVSWGGDNSSSLVHVPSGLSGIVAISAGESFSLALRADGTVVAWGYNYGGRTDVPAGLSDVVAIAAGIFQSLALKRDGTVVAWGSNDYGGTSVPAGLGSVTAIAAGLTGSVVLKADGSLVHWEKAGYDVILPREIAGKVLSISAIWTFGLALVREPALAPRLISPVACIARVGSDRLHYRVVESSGTATVAASGLPPGLVIDSPTWAITGTPTTAGTYTVTFTATNAHGTTTKEVKFYVNP